MSLTIFFRNTFSEVPTEDHFSRIANLSHDFESFHFEISPWISASVLNLVLRKHSDSLKSLRLRQYPYPFQTLPITLQDVTLNHVTFLEVSNEFLPSLSFLPLMPALTSFHVILRDYRNLGLCEIVQNTTDPSRVSHVGVKSVYIEAPLCSNDCIKKLAICFPSLQSLRLRVNNEMLGEICSQVKHGISSGNCWNGLQSLHVISWDGLTDEGITGINQKVLELWGSYSNFKAKEQRTHSYIGDISGKYTLPNFETYFKCPNSPNLFKTRFEMLDH